MDNAVKLTLPERLEGACPSLARLLRRQFELTPQHIKGLSKRFDTNDESHLQMADQVAGWVCTLAGENLDSVLKDYDWICQLMQKEELHFLREGQYRLSTFEEANREVYSNHDFMVHYMNGLLISQVWWSNHTESFRFYQDSFLAGFEEPFNHLEIGPGHGLLMLLAGSAPLCRNLEGWDVSEASVHQTSHALKRLGLTKKVKLHVRNLFDAERHGERYNSVVLSEVLEHLEQPHEALQIVRELLTDGGRLYINFPVNSPAPDHLFLLKTPEAVIEFVEKCGFRIEEYRFEPQTGLSLDRARKLNSTISVALIAQRF